MRRTLNGAMAGVGALALTGGIMAATALPAAAAARANVAYAAGASGLLGGIQPLGEASYPGTSPVTLAQVSGLGLVNAGAVNDMAGPASASSRIANLGGLAPLGLAPGNTTAGASAPALTTSTNPPT